MLNTRFEEYKMKRELKRSGKNVTFYRDAVDEFGWHTGAAEVVASFKCIYHETNSYVSESVGDATVSRTVKLPMLLCLAQDIVLSHVSQGDYVMLLNIASGESKKYVVTGITDISDFGIIADISLRVVDDGTAS